MDNWLIFQYNLIFAQARLEGSMFRLMKVSTGLRRVMWTEGGASSGVTRLDIQSMLMNSCVSCKLMLLEVNPLEFASSDAKCFAFGRVILEILAD